MLRTLVLAVALLGLAAPAAAEDRTSSWSSERMRLTPPPPERYRPPSKAPPFHDELSGNCAGLTVMTKTRIERLKALEEKAGQLRWPPPSPMAQWNTPPAYGDIARQREQIARLNAALGAKGCQPLNLETELQRTPAPAAGARRK